MVFGLGTRAVDRTGDDYSWLVALNVPLKRLESKTNKMREFSQRRVDLLDLRANALLSKDFETVAQTFPPERIGLFASSDEMESDSAAQRGEFNKLPSVLTFERLLGETEFAASMRSLLRIVQRLTITPWTLNSRPISWTTGASALTSSNAARSK